MKTRRFSCEQKTPLQEKNNRRLTTNNNIEGEENLLNAMFSTSIQVRNRKRNNIYEDVEEKKKNLKDLVQFNKQRKEQKQSMNKKNLNTKRSNIDEMDSKYATLLNLTGDSNDNNNSFENSFNNSNGKESYTTGHININPSNLDERKTIQISQFNKDYTKLARIINTHNTLKN
jgi:hypothetical protein